MKFYLKYIEDIWKIVYNQIYVLTKKILIWKNVRQSITK